MKPRLVAPLLILVLGSVTLGGPGPSAGATPPARQCAPAADYPAATTPIAFWSTEARCAIVPAGPGGVIGAENFGSKFPGEAAVYMGIVHVAMYDAAVAVYGGYRPYASIPAAPANTSIEAAIATATYDVLTGLQPQLGADQAVIDHDYTAYLNAIPDGAAKTNGISVGAQAARAVLALRVNDGRGCSTTLQDLGPPAPGPGVWQPNPSGPVLGLCLPGMRPLALQNAGQFRPDGPNDLTSRAYADDLNQVKELGRADSATRTPGQTDAARFWTDHDLRQWNDSLLELADERGLGLMQTARMLAMAHVAGGDAMIACFDAKYHYYFWRPDQAVPRAGTDDNADTAPDPVWQPLGATPNFPEYPSAHACHSTSIAVVVADVLDTDRVSLAITSRAPGVTHRLRHYSRLHDVVREVDWARVLVGFHFLNSDMEGTSLGRKVARHVVGNLFTPEAEPDTG